MIIEELKKDTIINLIKSGQRIDGRGFYDYREIKIEKDVLSSAEGSARVKLGNTQVLVGVKVDLSVPYPEKPNEGTLSVNAELLPLASPTFEVGPPNEDAIELARIVDRGIRSSEAIDLKSLYIEEEKVWGIYVDIYILDHDGNLIDASAIASIAALQNLKIPTYEDGKVIREKYTKIMLREIPYYFTFAKIADKIILDPNQSEEIASSSRFTISLGEMIYAIQKGGSGSFKKREIYDMIDIAVEKKKEFEKKFESILKW
ncbi:MAG: exosome complex protein Rrp42 [Candidatus Micrarchaeia archaeon]